MRFAARITNPNPVPLSGVVTSWEAFDADGAYVAAHSHRFPLLAANSDFWYVGGAGGLHLTGTPVRVEIYLDDAGVAAPDAVPKIFTTKEVAMDGPNFLGTLEINALVESPDTNVDGSRIDASWVLFDSADRILYADWGFAGVESFPNIVRPNSLLRVKSRFLDADSFANRIDRVEVMVYEEES
jgi:hypothetical protein